MKQLICLALTFLILCSLASPAFATEISDGNDVVAKYETTYVGEFRAEVSDGRATAGGVTITNAPVGAVTLVVIPMEGEALAWVDGCVDGDAVAAYDIHFLDVSGKRINANGASVSITVSGTDLTVSSVNTFGDDKPLATEASGGKVAFTTDGSHYYIMAEKLPTLAVDPDSPQTGDTSNLWLWWLLLIISAMGITAICIEQRKCKAMK